MDYFDLIKFTAEIKKNAYAPYSNFHVGAGILLKNGEIIGGVNVENAAYGDSICAERSALMATYSKGYRKDDILAIAISADTPTHITPCGTCRQVISELMNSESEVIMLNRNNETKIIKVKELLPGAFSKEFF